ncbi:MAG: T9SS type A sorting domain-containing protein, partial [Bacteroidales bacterium]|nr:T9SS type A sorting domain-containing protein [Bacteroidales bacterium]
SGSAAWVTNLTGDYNTNEISYVLGPVFDFTNISHPQIELKVWWDVEGFYDGASLQYKVGGGAWKTLGKYIGGERWYNVSYILSLQQGFNLQQDDACGWSGDGEWGYGSDGWFSAYYALTQLGNRPVVRFRVVFTSNSEYQNDGFAFDNIRISNDLTGIDESKEWLSDIRIYPNPNTGIFYLTGRFPDEGSLTIHVVNLQGQVVFEKQVHITGYLEEELDLSYMPKGIYYLRLGTRDGIRVKKLIIQ